MDDKVVEIADFLLKDAKTYREALIECAGLFKNVSKEIELRALEREVR